MKTYVYVIIGFSELKEAHFFLTEVHCFSIPVVCSSSLNRFKSKLNFTLLFP